MKTLALHTKSLLGLVLSAVFAPLIHAQSPAIAIDRTQYFRQMSSAAPAAEALPVAFNINIRGGLTDMSTWAPAFYKPGTSQTPQTGPNSATNTGTLNFPAASNNGGDFMFVHDFGSAAALESFYPNGSYGIVFQNGAALDPDSFTAGLQFDNSAYPAATPQITSVDNGAQWLPSGVLRLQSSGMTTLQLNTFAEYNTATYGAVIGVGIYESATGNVVGNASVESYNLPLGDSSATPAPHYDAPITQVSIDSSWLRPGVSYTVEIHYTLLSGRPEEANLTPTGGNPIEFQGVASSRKITTLSLIIPSPNNPDFNRDGQADIIWRNTQTGEWAFWLMNGTNIAAGINKGTMPLAWQITGRGDFNSDGQTDLLWRNTQTGEWAFWLMNGTNIAAGINKGVMPLNWQIVGTGDFNADDKSDIVWRNTQTGEYAFWLMNGMNIAAGINKGVVSLTMQLTATGDFNADGKSDLVWRNTQTGEYAFWLMNGTNVGTVVNKPAMPLEWQITGSGDFNVDGHFDLIWRNTTSGDYAFWLLNGTTLISGQNKGPMPLQWQTIR